MKSDKESQKPILPKDLFRSPVTWVYYEESKHHLPLAVEVFCFLSGLIMLGLDITYKRVHISAIFGVILEICSPFIKQFWIKCRRLKTTTELAQQVLEFNPGFDNDKWESLSSTSNIVFYQKRIWGTPYFFFNGQDAQRTFKENVLKPYFKGKFNGDNTNEIEASRVYLQVVQETFNSSLQEDLPELVSEQALPRDAHKSKFLTNLGYVGIAVFMSIFQSIMLFFITKSLLQRSLTRALWSLISDLLFSVYFWYHVGMHLVYPPVCVLHGIKLLALITKLAPGRNLDKWDEIARYMNQYATDNGQCWTIKGITVGKFFDGKQCLEFYEKYIEPLSKGTSRLGYVELTEIVKLTQPYVAE